MKKFKFRFQSVLELREKELEKAEQKLGQAQMEVFKAQNYLKKLHQDIQQNKLSLKNNLDSGINLDIFLVRNYQNYISSLEKKVEQQHKVIRTLEKKLEETRKEMLIVRQKKIMLDKLKEKEFKQYIKDFEDADLKIIDEIATNRHLRT